MLCSSGDDELEVVEPPPVKKQKATTGRATSTRTEKVNDKAPKKTAPVPDNALTRLIKGKSTKSSATATAPSRDHVRLVVFHYFVAMIYTRVAPRADTRLATGECRLQRNVRVSSSSLYNFGH